jgi:hypothetical protein
MNRIGRCTIMCMMLIAALGAMLWLKWLSTLESIAIGDQFI